jgi:hypothetical protein
LAATEELLEVGEGGHTQCEGFIQVIHGDAERDFLIGDAVVFSVGGDVALLQGQLVACLPVEDDAH